MVERGAPVDRVLPVGATSLIEELTRQGVLGMPRRVDRPAARGIVRAQAAQPVSDLVSENRG